MAFRPKDDKERILHRLKIAKGHLEKVTNMVQTDEYCIDILHQMQAIESGIKETGNVLLENHLKTCVSEDIKNGKADKAITEVMEVFRRRSQK